MKSIKNRIFNRDQRTRITTTGSSLEATKNITGVTVTDGTNTCTHNLGKFIDYVVIYNSSRKEIARMDVANSASPYNSFTFDVTLGASLTNCTLVLFFKN